MKTGIGQDTLCTDCGIDTGAIKELLKILEGSKILDKLKMGGYTYTAQMLEAAIKKVKV